MDETSCVYGLEPDSSLQLSDRQGRVVWLFSDAKTERGGNGWGDKAKTG